MPAMSYIVAVFEGFLERHVDLYELTSLLSTRCSSSLIQAKASNAKSTGKPERSRERNTKVYKFAKLRTSQACV